MRDDVATMSSRPALAFTSADMGRSYRFHGFHGFHRFHGLGFTGGSARSEPRECPLLTSRVTTYADSSAARTERLLADRTRFGSKNQGEPWNLRSSSFSWLVCCRSDGDEFGGASCRNWKAVNRGSRAGASF